ncbi:MAG: peptide deformylase [Nitrospirota bacterium]
MAVLEIKEYPHPILAQKALCVKDFNHNLNKLINDMIETMFSNNGVGLAAPQVGYSLRIFTFSINKKDGGQEEVGVVINPEIISQKGEIREEEGCLSVPDYQEKIKRKSMIVVTGFDINGKRVTLEAEGLLARIFQHEIDHLNGILLIDRISRLKRDIFLRKMKKKIKQRK